MARSLCIVIVLYGLTVGWCFAHPGHDDADVQEAIDASDSGARPLVIINVRDGIRYITSNGLPNHSAGQFPNAHNPNRVSPQHYEFQIPVDPKVNDQPIDMPRTLFGVALNGVVFDPGTAEWWRNDPSLGWRMEAIGGPRNLGLDQNNAHVQPNGAYHYHGIPTGLIQKLAGKDPKQPVQIGWAADGFPIYGPTGYADPKDPRSKLVKLKTSYRLKPGDRPAPPDGPGGKYDGSYTRDWEYVKGTGDLDECNGRFGVTKEFPNGTYYYVVTADYPFVPRLFRGTPDPSFQRRRPPMPPRRGGPPPGPRAAASTK